MIIYFSRSRKIRCDGAKPLCYNCVHRNTGKCDYDPVPKRRGPDRNPGSRQRPGRSKHDETQDAASAEVRGEESGTEEATPKSARKRSTTSSSSTTDAATTWVNVQLPAAETVQRQEQNRRSLAQDPGGTPTQSLPAEDKPIPPVAYSISDEQYDGQTTIVSAGTVSSTPQLGVPRLSTGSAVGPSINSSIGAAAQEQSSRAEYDISVPLINIGAFPQLQNLDSSSTVANSRSAPPHPSPEPLSAYQVLQQVPSGAYVHFQNQAAALSTPTHTATYHEYGGHCNVGYHEAPPDSEGGILPSTSSGRSRLSSSASPSSSSYGDYSSPDASLPSQPVIVEPAITTDQHLGPHIDYVSVSVEHPTLQNSSSTALTPDVRGLEEQSGCTVFDPNTVTHVVRSLLIFLDKVISKNIRIRSRLIRFPITLINGPCLPIHPLVTVMHMEPILTIRILRKVKIFKGTKTKNVSNKKGGIQIRTSADLPHLILYVRPGGTLCWTHTRTNNFVLPLSQRTRRCSMESASQEEVEHRLQLS